MRNPFLSLLRARDKPQNAVSAAQTFYFGSSTSGKSVNPRNAVQVSTVYACVRVISETIASLPMGVYEATENGSQKSTQHPLYRLLHDEPNPEMSSFIWRETMLSHLLLWGNSYSQIIRSGKTIILGLYPLLPDRMEIDMFGVRQVVFTIIRRALLILARIVIITPLTVPSVCQSLFYVYVFCRILQEVHILLCFR